MKAEYLFSRGKKLWHEFCNSELLGKPNKKAIGGARNESYHYKQKYECQ